MSTCGADAPRRAWRLALLLATVVALATTWVPAPSLAQPGRAGSDPGVTGQVEADQDVRLVVARLTGVVGPGAVPDGVAPPEQVLVRILVEHRGQEELQDVEVVLETFGRLISRTALHQALDDGVVDAPRLVRRFRVREGVVEPGDIAAVDAFLDVDRITDAGRTGVYPVKATLMRGTTVLDQVTTAVVHLGELPVNPLEAVLVWPIDTMPTDALRGTGPDGAALPDDLDAQLAPGGRLDDLVAGLEAAPSSGILAAPSATLLASLARRSSPDGLPDPDVPTSELDDAERELREQAEPARAMLARLRALLTSLTHDPVAGAFADADLTALLEAGPTLARLAGELAAEGPQLVGGLGGRSPDPATHVGASPLDPRALDLLPGDHLLLPWQAVEGPDLALNPDLPFPIRRLRSASGRLLTATVADPWVTLAVAEPADGHGSVVAAQRVLAETALVQFESPGVADRPLLMLPPRDWSPDGNFTRALAPALVNAPWLRLSPGSAHADAAAGFLQEASLASGVHLAPEVVAAIGGTRGALAGLTASMPEDSRTISGHTVAALDDQLRRATSNWFADNPSVAAAMVAEVGRAVEDSYGQVDVPTADAITLTGEQGRIPITIRRPSGDPIEVEVEVRSRGTLAWPNGTIQRRRLGPGETRTLSFDVTTRSRGDVPVEVVVRDLAGRVLAEETIRVRSTFVSGPALAVTAGVVVLLLLVGRLRRRPGRGEPDEPPANATLAVLAGSDEPSGGGP